MTTDVVGEVGAGVGEGQLVLQRVADLRRRVVGQVGDRLGDGVERRGVQVDLGGDDAGIEELAVRRQDQRRSTWRCSAARRWPRRWRCRRRSCSGSWRCER